MILTLKIGELFSNFFHQMGWFSGGEFDPNFWLRMIMVAVGLLLIFLAIRKGFEPYLLIPIGVGMLLVNLDPNLYNAADETGLLYQLHQGISYEIFPPLIFLGIGATTDFGPLIANPKSLILGAAAQLGIFVTFILALVFGYDGLQAAAIGIIGGADGPTAIFLSNKLLGSTVDGQALCAIIAVIAYSYMALVPVIQPPIIKALTTHKERKIHMDNIREVSKRERIIFPLMIMVISILIIPSSSALIGMLMLGNLIKESGVVPELVQSASKTIMYTVTILLGLSVGATATITMANALDFVKIFVLGIVAFSFATAGGVLAGKLMCKLTRGKVNPMIGAAGVSAVPMAARVVHKLGQEEDDSNYLLMAAMGPNVAGVIGSAVAAGLLLGIFG